MDELFEMKAPNAEQRAKAIQMVNKELNLGLSDSAVESLARKSEYFKAFNIHHLALFLEQHRNEVTVELALEFIAREKDQFYPQTAQNILDAAPDWNNDVGGLIK